MNAVLAVTFGYFMGSIPFAFLLSWRRGVDLRRVGSGNVGASNVLRTTGIRPAVVAMALDAFKGTVAVLVASVMTDSPATAAATACASVIGHVYPVWLRFRGGKGVATAAGAFAVLTPVAIGVAVLVFLVAVGVTRFISVGSIAAALTLAIVAAVSDTPAAVAVGATVSALIVVYAHRGNLVRLASGTERRIGQRVDTAASAQLRGSK